MCFDYDGYAEFAQESYPITRKPHRCEACRAVIPAGEMAKHTAGKFDGAFFSNYLCNVCAQLELIIVRSELEEDCRWSEAWPPWNDMINYAEEAHMIWYDEEAAAWKGKPEPGADLRQLRLGLDEFYKSLRAKAEGETI